MRTRRTNLLAILFVAAVACSAVAQDVAVLKVVGKGGQGRPAYRGGGVVKFLDVSVAAQVVHCQSDGEMPLPLAVDYDVLETAPILLTSRLGTEYWQIYHFSSESMAAMYTDEKIDLSSAGKQTSKTTSARVTTSYGAIPKNGLVGIRGHYYFLVDKPDGKWIDVTNPPAFFDQASIAKKLTFTLADLSHYELSIPEIRSTWKPGGPVQVRIVVTDANKNTSPVVNLPVIVTAGDWQAELTTGWTPLTEPTGWMCGTLPETVPQELMVTANVTVATLSGLQERMVSAKFRRGDGLLNADKFKSAEHGFVLPRTGDGTVRETRAIWVSGSDIGTPVSVDTLVDRCKRCRLNTIVPSIFVRNAFLATSSLLPPKSSVETSFDPLGYLIKKAHAVGLEVHPWFCVTYRDGHFRRWFAENRGANVDMIDQEGQVISLGADVHRPEYRKFIVDLMVGVARDYPVDGIHLDYIRTMGRCYCDACRREFAEQFATPLDQATDAQWVVWQRQAIGDIVERTAKRCWRVRPDAMISAAVFANMSGGASQGQDPATWAEKKWVDLVMPMDYKMQALQVRSDERRFLDALADDYKLVTGLSLYMRSSGTVMSRPPELVEQQIELVRQMGIHGYCLFAFGHLSEEQVRVLRDKVNVEPAVPYFRHPLILPRE